MAFFLTSHQLEEMSYESFGCPQSWDGIGIFLDTYSNQNQFKKPMIMGMYNKNKALRYEEHYDGLNEGNMPKCLKVASS